MLSEHPVSNHVAGNSNHARIKHFFIIVSLCVLIIVVIFVCNGNDCLPLAVTRIVIGNLIRHCVDNTAANLFFFLNSAKFFSDYFQKNIDGGVAGDDA